MDTSNFSGFFAMVAQGNEKIRELLGLKGSKENVTYMVIGYQNVRHIRIVPRKDASILWK